MKDLDGKEIYVYKESRASRTILASGPGLTAPGLDLFVHVQNENKLFYNINMAVNRKIEQVLRYN